MPCLSAPTRTHLALAVQVLHAIATADGVAPTARVRAAELLLTAPRTPAIESALTAEEAEQEIIAAFAALSRGRMYAPGGRTPAETTDPPEFRSGAGSPPRPHPI